MKLFNRVLIHLLVGITVILSAWAVCFYMAIVEEINDEVDDSLEDYSELIIIRSLAGKELPSHDSGSNNQYFLRPITEDYAATHPNISYRDSMVYIVEKKETEPARILTNIFRDEAGQYYELTVSTPTIEKEDLRESIFYLLIVLFIALLLTILIINVWVFRQSMKPFYRLLAWLDSFRLGQKNVPLDNDTRITEFRTLNEAVLRYARHSEEVFEQQKQFIGNASHEIQTPLAVCRARLEMLMEDETLSEAQLEEIIKTHQTLEHVSKLNKSLLLLSKIDNHQFDETTELCLNALLQRYLEDYREVYGHLGIHSQLEVEADFRVWMNDTLATVLLTNLLKNAYAHNRSGGTLLIKVCTDRITFQNTGASEALDGGRIFERFYQGSKKEGSTGLGLAIVKAVCRQSGLRIEYRYGEGLHGFIIRK